jgi:hypothetical protein
MAVPDAVLLFAVSGAHARIHVEHDASRRTATIDGIDPTAGETSKSRTVLFRRKPLRLEAAHLARRGRATRSRFAADDPAHRWIKPQAFGVVYVLVSSEAPEHRLSQQADESMPAIPAGARKRPYLVVASEAIFSLNA